MSFNEMMKKVRLEAGDSLRGLSDKTGINFSYIDKIERGTRCLLYTSDAADE